MRTRLLKRRLAASDACATVEGETAPTFDDGAAIPDVPDFHDFLLL